MSCTSITDLETIESELLQPVDDNLKAFRWVYMILKDKQDQRKIDGDTPDLDLHRELSSMM